MRFLFIALFISNSLFAKSSILVMKDYLSFIKSPREKTIEQLFTKEFIKKLGGKERVLKLYQSVKKKNKNYQTKKLKSTTTFDYVQVSAGKHKTTFILKKEGGSFKIDGTMKSE